MLALLKCVLNNKFHLKLDSLSYKKNYEIFISQGTSGLSQGTVAGICVGCIVVSSVATFIVTVMVMRSRAASKTTNGKYRHT